MGHETVDVTLICPMCQHPLEQQADRFQCTNCQAVYAIQEGVGILLRSDMTTFKQQELVYWNERYIQERAKQEPAFFYSKDRTVNDAWGLYRFSRYVDDLPKTASMLEVGSGSIPISFYYQRFRGFQNVIATDISVEAMITIKQYAESQQLETHNRYFAAEMGYLPFATHSFDLVMTHAALHHAEDADAAFAEMVRVLKPGGCLIIGHEPNTFNLQIIRFVVKRLKASEADVKDSYSVADDEDQSFSHKQLREMCRKYGIDVIEIRPVWLFAGVLFGMPNLMERVFKRKWKVSSAWMRMATKVDIALGKLPLINRLYFHWSLVGEKRR